MKGKGLSNSRPPIARFRDHTLTPPRGLAINLDEWPGRGAPEQLTLALGSPRCWLHRALTAPTGSGPHPCRLEGETPVEALALTVGRSPNLSVLLFLILKVMTRPWLA